jgi:DNA-binding NarL/FixJ family response regulator
LKCLEQNPEAFLLLDCNFFINQKDYLSSILELYPKSKILYLDDCPSFRNGNPLLPLGIKGYGNSRMSSLNLLQAIEVISDGNIWLYPEFIQKLIQESITLQSHPKKVSLEILTKKEKEIANLVAKGLSNKIIALKSNVSESTVKTHIHSIFNKLEVSDRLSLALLLR